MRFLLPSETVDHIDRDFTNNEISNLQVLDRKIHGMLDAKRAIYPRGECLYCGKCFILSRHQVNAEAKSKLGPFCSRRCSGKFLKHHTLKTINQKMMDTV